MATKAPQQEGWFATSGLEADWWRVAVVVLGSLVLALGLLRLHPLSPPLEVYGARQAGLPASAGWAFRYVTAREAQLLLSRRGTESSLFLDVRGRADYDKLHASHATSLPYRDLIARIQKGWWTGEPCVIYAYGTASPLAVQAAAALEPSPDHVFVRPRLYVIRGGFEEWQQAGLPVEKGGPPLPLTRSADGPRSGTLPRAAGESAERTTAHRREFVRTNSDAGATGTAAQNGGRP